MKPGVRKSAPGGYTRQARLVSLLLLRFFWLEVWFASNEAEMLGGQDTLHPGI